MAQSRQVFIVAFAVLVVSAVAQRNAADGGATVAKDAPKPLRVAVVGAGVGGASLAHFLRAELGDTEIEMTVFERSKAAGGRARTDKRSQVELGASMAILDNRYMRTFVEDLGLTMRAEMDRPGRGSGKMAILSKPAKGVKPRGFSFLEPDGPLRTALALAWRYGPLRLWRLRAAGKALIAGMEGIYAAQDGKRSFRTVGELMATAADSSGGGNGGIDITMDDWTRQYCRVAMHSWLQDNAGADSLIASELVAALMRNNYGQDWGEANALCCGTAVAPLAGGGSAAAWSVDHPRGNSAVAEGLLERSGASVRYNTAVTAVARASDSVGGGRPPFVVRCRSTVKSKDGGSVEVREEEHYDFVVIASPLDGSGIDVSGLARRSLPPPVAYQHVHTTLVSGILRPSYFGMTQSSKKAVPLLNSLGDILTTASADVPFSSIGRYRDDVDGSGPLWKFFSPEPLSDADLDAAFESHNSVQRHSWTSPGAYPISRAALGADERSFVLDEHHESGGAVLYTAAIEVATSAMEVAAVSGRNAALLVAERRKAKAPSEAEEASGVEISIPKQRSASGTDEL